MADPPDDYPIVERPMFPLSSPLLPIGVMPLHIFEPRYRAMARHCVDGDRRFGVVLIERGSEVGGGDVRAEVGCVAQISHPQELPDGRWTLLAQGIGRIRILEWLPDDPYPRALTQAWGDDFVELSDATRDALTERIARMHVLLGLHEQPDADDEGKAAMKKWFGLLVDEPMDDEMWSFLAATLIPAGAYDRQRMLCAPDPQARIEIIGDVIDGLEEMAGER